MTPIVVRAPGSWDEFRASARTLAAQQVVPHRVIWSDSDTNQRSLISPDDLTGGGAPLKLPRSYIEAGEGASLHRSHEKWALLYRLLWRLLHETRSLMEIAGDEDVSRLYVLTKAVKRDMHKMTAFVRFRSVQCEDGERFVAFYKPDHLIVRATAPFFARRFPAMRWSILTPDTSVHHENGELQFTEGVLHDPISDTDPHQALWQTYYASTFNPARMRTKAMRAEMPTRFWPLLPETRMLHGMLNEASGRTTEMVTQPIAAVAPKMGESPRIRIGVAGWDYADWADVVYSSRTGTDKLRSVAKRFDTIEINSTFYRPVSQKAATDWCTRIGHLPHFRFTAKIWRRFTHERGTITQQDVRQVRKGFDVLLEHGRLVTTVLQFPWSFKQASAERQWLLRVLHAFDGLPIHVEFRHDSWLRKQTFALLEDNKAGFVNIDQPPLPGCIRGTEYVTNRIAYIRLHGRNQENWFRAEATRDERFDYLYSNAELLPWQRRVDSLAQRSDVDGVHVVFNNHYRAQAVKNAVTFARLLKAD